MTIKAVPQPGAETYALVKAAIEEIRAQSENLGLVTICWPTDTTALVMRRTLMADVGGTCAIRNTTARAMRELINDRTPDSSHYVRARTVHDWSQLVPIAQELFPHSSPWRKITQVDSTLAITSGLSEEQLRYVEHNFPLASACHDRYFAHTSVSQPDLFTNYIDHLVGTLVLVGHGALDDEATALERDFGSCVSHVIVSASTAVTSPLDVDVYDEPLGEIDTVLSKIANDGLERGVSSMALVIPDSSYRRYVIESARIRGIPIAGGSPETLLNHEILSCAHTLLDEPDASAAIFRENFSWLSRQSHDQFARDFADCKNGLLVATQLSDHFIAIGDFLEANMDAKYFATSDDEIELAQKAFAVINECSQIAVPATHDDAMFVLELVSQSTRREQLFGHGIYIAQPSEILGSYFRDVYVVGFNDRYIVPAQHVPTFINRDQYPVLGIAGPFSYQDRAYAVMSWLRSSAKNIHVSSSRIDMKGKDMVLSPWCQKIYHMCERPFDARETFDAVEKVRTLENILSTTPNGNNIAYSLPITSLRATDVEALARCPLQFFHKRVLRIQEEQEAYNPDLLHYFEKGNSIHDLLEKYVVDNLDSEALREKLRELIISLHSSGSLPHLASIDMNISEMAPLVETFLELMASSDAKSYEAEYEVSGTLDVDGKEIAVRGKIDRMDIYDDHVRVVDYKSNKESDKTSPDFFRSGRRLQLAIYACMLHDTHSVEGLEYWYLKDKAKLAVAKYELTPDSIEELKRHITNIVSIVNTGVFLGRETMVTLTKKGVKISSPCETCEFDRICYSEFRDHWDRVIGSNDFRRYAESTNVFEVIV